MTLQNHITNAAKKSYELFKETPVKELLEFKRSKGFAPLVDFQENTSIRDVLKALSIKNILAAPVYRQSNEDGKTYIGIISVYDILSFSVFQEIFESEEEFNERNLFDFVERMEAKEFFNTPIKQVLGSSLESTAPWIAYSTDSLATLLGLFTTAKQHRVIVIDSDVLLASINGPVPPTAAVTILTQTDFVRFFYESRSGNTSLPSSLIEPFLDVQIKQVADLLKQQQKPVIAMLDTQTALHGMRTMYVDGLQAIPVITAEGQVVATLSASDVRGLNMNNISTLNKPVFDFLQKERRTTEILKADQLRTVDEEETVETAIKTILKSKVHRVWVTRDGYDDLAGVVSLTDVLQLINPLRDD
ncbi:hypothetical protein BC833DRAFT_604014 [Globomyces pollinis-pini]|nr:hypothetical protein BC833DRAFT_604014 [Globomyces pollinis-pini]